MSTLSRRGVFVCIAVVALCGRALAADFVAPANDVISEAQFKAYMAAETELVKAVPALQQQLDSAQTPDAEAAAKAAANQKVTDCAAAQQLSREEYDWIDDQAMKAYNALLGVEQFTDQKNKDLEAQVEANNAKFAAAKANLAAYTAAQKDGRRVMTDAQKAATTQAAAADKEKSVGLLHEDTDALTAANAAVQRHQQEWTTADTDYKNPPSELDAVAEASYKLQKADDREKALSAIEDARRAVADAQSDIDLDNAHIKADDAHLAHPDLPATAAEKAEIDKLNADTIAAAQKDIEDATKFAAGVDEAKAKIAADADALAKDVPPQNIKLIQDHRDQYAKVLSGLGITPTPVAPEPPPPPPATPPPDDAAMQQP